ncbi:hypothetical protein BO70DRAFT_384359 [Aspergillus heteromorphus CBS 117.55]|uniref:F-box domain-containing protein n=1 Tax=Aspergillus heteromorphus CBS 117.55 TaxID=1448321 RepID=A0A317WXH5_9EURO|nr:uncharacterized protein BO70DRAFT_384359 [Aspergillus heteromorphus CBS 117.55]PWY90715.1 hypothetical protein BO70DRAFT_384359 [Aspergillus heteromorphus CBS 117.55]
MSQHQSDIFTTLPWHILEAILEKLEDLSSLHSIYRASPAVFSLLHEDGTARRIIQRIMDSSMPAETRVLICKFACLRWNARLVADMDSFIEQYVNNDKYTNLPRELPLGTLCDILAASATIHYLAHAGIHEMIDRCMALEFFHTKNEDLKYMRGFGRHPTGPRERMYQEDVGAPSAVEEQRVIRALWSVFLTWELRDAVYGLSPRLNWSADEVQKLQNLHTENIWHCEQTWKGHVSGQLMEEARTMVEWCSCLFPTLPCPVERYHAAKALARRAQWQYQCNCPPPRAIDIGKRDDEITSEALSYKFVTRRLATHCISPLLHVSFRVFRCFGFVFWDQERMAALGLLPSRDGSPALPQAPRSELDMYARWVSILNADELDEIEERKEHFVPGTERPVCGI